MSFIGKKTNNAYFFKSKFKTDLTLDRLQTDYTRLNKYLNYLSSS